MENHLITYLVDVTAVLFRLSVTRMTAALYTVTRKTANTDSTGTRHTDALPSRHLSICRSAYLSMRYQQERSVYQDRLLRASTTTLSDIEKGESIPSLAPHDNHGMLQLLSNYIRLLTVIVGPISAHTREVVAIRRKLRTKVDLLHIDVGPREITCDISSIMRCTDTSCDISVLWVNRSKR
jgi:hypothetical protein